jgi:DNA processing protein
VESGGVSPACDACLRRGTLIGFLSPHIGGLLRPGRRAPGLLSLSETELIAAVGGAARPAAQRLLEDFDPEAPRADLDRSGTAALCRHARSYPERLGYLPDPPNPLYVRGGVDRLARLAAEPCVAIVGGRRPSEYARGVARQMGRDLAAAGVTVVSGLALGIDGESHRGALAAEGAALAVLAGGPDVPYPRRHTQLYHRVLESGVIVSELPPGTEPRPWSFPARNRIMVGFAQTVVVVEAREASGSLITADFAQQAGREVAAVPGHVNASVATGSNGLLQEGAAFVRGAEDVLDLVFGVGVGPRPSVPDVALEPRLREVLDAVEAGDSLPAAGLRSGLSSSELRAALGRLETLGLVRRDGMGGYERSLALGRRT